jgi:prolyl-tRNA synthetase
LIPLLRKEKVCLEFYSKGVDYPDWFQQVIKAADMAENSPVRGF